jgi:hypothetical protein
MSPKQAVALLHSTSHAIKAEKLLKTAGIACTLIPVPRHLSSDCGICLRFDAAEKKNALAALEAGNIALEGVHDLPDREN